MKKKKIIPTQVHQHHGVDHQCSGLRPRGSEVEVSTEGLGPGLC